MALFAELTEGGEVAVGLIVEWELLSLGQSERIAAAARWRVDTWLHWRGSLATERATLQSLHPNIASVALAGVAGMLWDST
jgi:hypothetical protein